MTGVVMGGFAVSVVLAIAVFSAATGALALARPRRFGGMLGLAAGKDGGENEIRAQYGGFFLAVAVVCAAALAGRLPLAAGLILGATVFGGLIFGRLFSVATGERFGGYLPGVRALYVIDSLGFLASLAALLTTPK